MAAQIMALHEHVMDQNNGQQPIRAAVMLPLRGWAVYCLAELGDSTALAITCGTELLADCEQTLGKTHSNTLQSRHNLATAYWAAGRLDEAITLHERTLTDREQSLGSTHPDTLLSRRNLAAAYHDAGRLDEAQRLRDQNAQP